MRTWGSEFKQFVLRGNVVDLAVGIVIGAAFATVVQALVKDIITPLIAAIFGQPDFATLSFTIHRSTFRYGDFLNAAFSFMTIAFAVFVFVVKPVNTLTMRFRRRQNPDPTLRKCPQCVNDIPLAAKRCGFCTSEVAPATT